MTKRFGFIVNEFTLLWREYICMYCVIIVILSLHACCITVTRSGEPGETDCYGWPTHHSGL